MSNSALCKRAKELAAELDKWPRNKWYWTIKAELQAFRASVRDEVLAAVLPCGEMDKLGLALGVFAEMADPPPGMAGADAQTRAHWMQSTARLALLKLRPAPTPRRRKRTP